MRIHVHNLTTGPLAPVTPDDFAGFSDCGHAISFGTTLSEFQAVAGEVEILLTATYGLKALLPIDAPRLRAISCMSAGLEMLAPYDWLPPRVVLLNNSGAHGAKAAEYAVMALLMLANDMPRITAAQHQRSWVSARPGVIAGKRLTVLGLGAIGQACAAAARRMGMVVTGVRRHAGDHPDCARVIAVDDLAQALPETDYLLATLPMTPQTHHLLGDAMLALLPAHAGVINIGRGGVIDERALCDRLDAGHLGGAVLDVFENEPLGDDAPVWTTRNLVVTPHTSSDDPASHNRLTVGILLDNLRAIEDGRSPPNAFDTASGTRAVAAA